ncbi:alpha/beta hydrolase [Spirosoma taeanense]|uniref:Alpha/beta hydrolase n=1 Tax=Spirosoma taeanense TaxID=2735870 RepID=A0A6M5Y5X0_9BACT|nr:alpha/beta hydrolase [Spirosoma taeanense]QJW88092.1 alpha/beta hydrolase [Spirosoma taeanense]
MYKVLVPIVIFIRCTVQAQTIIPLYKGIAPGSENWTWTEKETSLGKSRILRDVSKPTLTAFIPAKPNGTAVIIAPGGGFHILSYTSEGTDVANWLNQKGITAFVLKYRLVHEDPAYPENGLMAILQKRDFKKLDSVNAPVVQLALQDGIAAMRYVRQHAEPYHIDPNKIGFMGFSAGATLTMSVVYSATDESRPNFVAPIYPYENAIIGKTIPETRVPIFITAASDDNLGLASHSVHIYQKWLEAGQSAELHIYQKGGYGFGMNKQNIPTDSWINRFYDWLQLNYP